MEIHDEIHYFIQLVHAKNLAFKKLVGWVSYMPVISKPRELWEEG